MKKNGFTLVEFLAVIVIISILTVLVIPNILNVVNKKRDDISDVTKDIIFDATELYVDENEADYPKDNGNIYCIKLEDLVNDNKLTAPLKDYKTGKEIPLANYVETTIVDSYNMSFEIKTNCNQVIIED